MTKRQMRKEAKEAKKQKKLQQKKLRKKKKSNDPYSSSTSSSSTSSSSYFEVSEQDQTKRKDRAKRFERSSSKARSSERGAMENTMHTLELLRGVASRGGNVNWDDVIVKGTSTELLKDYYRLNEVPDPTTVRSETILQKSVESLKLKHQIDPPSSKLYSFLNNQYKAIRQDLTVQHVKNAFVVDVYETHAR